MTHPDALRRATLVSAGLLATLPFARSVLAQAAAASSQPARPAGGTGAQCARDLL
jgi:hypothetical protein